MTFDFDKLDELARTGSRLKIGKLFENGNRFADFSASDDGILLDFSKTHLTEESRSALLSMIDRAGVAAARDAMFAGEKINRTEGRAVLHTALRAGSDAVISVDGADVMPEVRQTLARMAALTEAVRSGTYAGQGGAFTDIVNIGIGGSDLGPAMAVQALAPYHDGPRCHFVSNVDGAHLADVLKLLDPARTLVIVASKTFTTIETMTNAASARAWMAKSVNDPARQFVALSSSVERAEAFGIPAERVFGFEDWVGGRYSMWGPIGLSLMIAIGADCFDEMLSGARAMDHHFRNVPFAENLPVLLAMVGLWHHQGMGHATRAVIPYDQRLARLPAYLQQLEMESNGKGVAMSGASLERPASPVVWGEPGTNGQHAFFQLLHQGQQVVPVEFLIAAEGHEPEMAHHHRLLVANCLAQSQALMKGRSLDEARRIVAGRFEGEELEMQARQREFTGNRPSVTIAYDKLTPYRLGQIVALYEHRVFVEGVVCGINSFDQWGVELGKELATALQPVVEGRASTEGLDSSTAGLASYLRT
jgi:glucose-6-phosphate isomerase